MRLLLSRHKIPLYAQEIAYLTVAVNDNSGLLVTVDIGTVWKNKQGKVITSYGFSKEDDKGLLIVSAKLE